MNTKLLREKWRKLWDVFGYWLLWNRIMNKGDIEAWEMGQMSKIKIKSKASRMEKVSWPSYHILILLFFKI